MFALPGFLLVEILAPGTVRDVVLRPDLGLHRSAGWPWATTRWSGTCRWPAAALRDGRAARRGAGARVKAVILAGGEGTRLRPLTSNQPKPMMPLVEPADDGAHRRPARPARLRRHRRHRRLPRQPDPHLLRRRLRLRVRMRYATEEQPLGTAGSVRNASSELDDTFLVISGDVLTDIDLTSLDEGAPRQRRVGVDRARSGSRTRSSSGSSSPAPTAPSSGSSRSRTWGAGVLRHHQHRHLRARTPDLRLHPRRGGRRLLRRRVPGRARPGPRAPRPRRRTATGRTSAPSRRTCAPTTTSSTGRCRSTSAGSSSATGCGSARAPSSTPTRRVDGPVVDRRQLPGRGRRAAAPSTRCSAPTSS